MSRWTRLQVFVKTRKGHITAALLAFALAIICLVIAIWLYDNSRGSSSQSMAGATQTTIADQATQTAIASQVNTKVAATLTAIPTATETATAMPTVKVENTQIAPPAPTSTDTSTPLLAPTSTNTPQPTNTPTPTPTPTPVISLQVTDPKKPIASSVGIAINVAIGTSPILTIQPNSGRFSLVGDKSAPSGGAGFITILCNSNCDHRNPTQLTYAIQKDGKAVFFAGTTQLGDTTLLPVYKDAEAATGADAAITNGPCDATCAIQLIRSSGLVSPVDKFGCTEYDDLAAKFGDVWTLQVRATNRYSVVTVDLIPSEPDKPVSLGNGWWCLDKTHPHTTLDDGSVVDNSFYVNEVTGQMAQRLHKASKPSTPTPTSEPIQATEQATIASVDANGGDTQSESATEDTTSSDNASTITSVEPTDTPVPVEIPTDTPEPAATNVDTTDCQNPPCGAKEVPTPDSITTVVADTPTPPGGFGQ